MSLHRYVQLILLPFFDLDGKWYYIPCSILWPPIGATLLYICIIIQQFIKPRQYHCCAHRPFSNHNIHLQLLVRLIYALPLCTFLRGESPTWNHHTCSIAWGPSTNHLHYQYRIMMYQKLDHRIHETWQRENLPQWIWMIAPQKIGMWLISQILSETPGSQSSCLLVETSHEWGSQSPPLIRISFLQHMNPRKSWWKV